MLQPEDYKEPACVFCTDFYQPEKQSVTPVPLRRILDKLDAHLGRNDYDAAERHLAYWLREAGENGDRRGLLSLENERMGLYRKLDRKTEAIACAKAALSLAEQTGLDASVTGATTFLNAATVFKAFGQADKALPYYERARAIYEEKLAPEDARLGGLYNNMALALCDLSRYSEARECYEKALSVMEHAENGALERAITELNLCNLAEAELGLLDAEDEIERRLDTAEKLLETETLPRNGYYAFVIEKCAPTFRYYGRFVYAAELEERAKEIYENARAGKPAESC